MNRRNTAIVILLTTLAQVVILLFVLSFFSTPSPIGAANWVGEDSSAFSIDPLRQDRFTSPGVTEEFVVPIVNDSISPVDTYEVELVTSTWPLSFYKPDGSTPLTDTNGIGGQDTGSVPIGGQYDLVVKVTAPPLALVGDDNLAEIRIKSLISPAAISTVTLQTAIPAPFARAYRDDFDGKMSLFMAQQDSQWPSSGTPYWQNGTDAAVVDIQKGFLHSWSKSRVINNNWMTEVEYTIVDITGEPLTDVLKLTDHSQVISPTFDIKPVVASNTDGQIGVAWYRRIANASGDINHNIYFAILDSQGSFITGPVNLTSNNLWDSPGVLNVPSFDSPRIAATDDGRFFLAWEQTHLEVTGTVQDIYYDIRDSSGSLISGPLNLTNGIPDVTGNLSPAIAELRNNRVLMYWIRRYPEDDDVFYTVLDSDGNTIRSIDNLSDNERTTDWLTFAASELSDGRILVTWKAWGCSESEHLGRLRYAILASTNYQRLGQAQCLQDVGIANGGDWGVSVVADAEKHGIVSWTDENATERHNLYYALIDNKGNIVTRPMIFYRSQSGSLVTGYEGYSSSPRLYVDGAIAFDGIGYDKPGNNSAFVGIHYQNGGTLTASSVVMTATLPAGLVYVSDTNPVSPTIIDNQVIWELPALPPLESDQFHLHVSLSSSGKLGVSYPITVSLSLSEPEASLSNNIATTEIKFVLSTYIPLITKNP